MSAADVRCCVVGGGPAGMMLGLLLARAGVSVAVLEKHADFLRDFRGDTLHPSTLEVMHELGLVDDLLRLPHQKAPQVRAQIGDAAVTMADFRHLPVRCPFIAFLPQWDFLDFLARAAGRYPGFKLRMNAEATGLIEENGRVVGVRAATPEGPLDIRADLVAGADGRHSTMRRAAGLAVEEFGAPMDVLWFRLSRQPDDPPGAMGHFGRGHVFVMIDLGTHWQCGLVIAKGAVQAIRAEGLPAFRERIARFLPFAGERTQELADWDQVKLLTVQVDRMPLWHRPGLLCIGDAAHAMSPIAGVGINLAIQDAVAAANLLAKPLREGGLAEDDLRRVQRRRDFPARMTQRLQLLVQNRVIRRVLDSAEPPAPPRALRLIARLPGFTRLTGRLIGMGLRPEHVRE